MQPYELNEPSLLANVRPARWSAANTAAHEAAHRLLDEAIEECSTQERAALDAPVPNVREAERWRGVVDELAVARQTLRPDHRTAVRAVRDRCLAVLDQVVRNERVRAALSVGRAQPLTPEAEQVRQADRWWIRYGIGYISAPEALVATLDNYATAMAAADAAVASERVRGRGAGR